MVLAAHQPSLRLQHRVQVFQEGLRRHDRRI